MNRNEYTIKRIITSILLFGFILTGLIDALLHFKKSYSSIMGMDINRVYIYTFILFTIGSWFLYNRWFVGLGFLALATFNSYFDEFLFLHNYFASLLIYIGILIDIIIKRKYEWLIALVICGIIQGIAFQTHLFGEYMVLVMEFTALCIGAIFIIKTFHCTDYKINTGK